MTDKKLIFAKADGTIITDVNQYVKDFLKEFPHAEVTIGCDSQAHARYVKYSVVIVMHIFNESKESNPDRTGHGAHVISASVVDRSKNLKTDLYTKLWAEAMYTVETAQMLDGCSKNVKIHLDYNSKEDEYSNVLYASGIGFVKGMGYEAYGKPHAWAASHAADDFCKGKASTRTVNK
jgi:predicted RNase H-related nuclease YkuK (DUF458 family)